MTRRGLLRDSTRRLRERVRGRPDAGEQPRAAPAAEQARQTEAPEPDERVSVVVAVNAPQEQFLGECLASLLDQTHDNLEILLVPHGQDADRLAAGVRRVAGEDPRVRVLAARAGSGVGAARDAGAAAATGAYVTFVGAADVVPRGGLRVLVRSLRQSGSSLARGGVTAVAAPVREPVPGETPGAGGRRLAVRDVPRVLGDLFVESTLFRLAFWREHGLAFREDGPRCGADPGPCLPRGRRLRPAPRSNVPADAPRQRPGRRVRPPHAGRAAGLGGRPAAGTPAARRQRGRGPRHLAGRGARRRHPPARRGRGAGRRRAVAAAGRGGRRAAGGRPDRSARRASGRVAAPGLAGPRREARGAPPPAGRAPVLRWAVPDPGRRRRGARGAALLPRPGAPRARRDLRPRPRRDPADRVAAAGALGGRPPSCTSRCSRS